MTRSSLLVASALSATMTATPAGSQAGPARARDFVQMGRAAVEIGKEAEQGPDLFGGIGSVTLDGRGAIFVLDVSDNSIRMFDPRGRFLARAGQPGRGPGDLASPHRILHDGDSTLYVIDAVNTGPSVSLAHSARASAHVLPVCSEASW